MASVLMDMVFQSIHCMDVKCVNCSRLSTSASVTLYVIIEIFSTTLFFVFVTVFHLNVASGPLLGYFFILSGFLLRKHKLN